MIILRALPVGYIIQCNANKSKQKSSHMSVWVPHFLLSFGTNKSHYMFMRVTDQILSIHCFIHHLKIEIRSSILKIWKLLGKTYLFV